jgi:hypothetical protein
MADENAPALAVEALDAWMCEVVLNQEPIKGGIKGQHFSPFRSAALTQRAGSR